MSKYALRHTKNYFANMTGVDDQFGRILKALEKQGLDKNTIVLFMSDHGDCVGIHNEVSKNNHYEESMHVPFIVRWPEQIKPRHDDLLNSAPDIYPTLLGLLEFNQDIPPEVEGSDYSNIMTGKGAQPQRPSSQLYLKMDFKKLEEGRRGVRTHRYKLMIDNVTQETVLYDLQKDPFELNNIANQEKAVVNELVEQQLDPWLKRTNDPWVLPEK